jgi:sugar (pentulose or hexulose) kinase
MERSTYFTAVVDFGKTNKKVLVYDQDLRVQDARRRTFEEVTIEGWRADDLAGAMAFVYEAIKDLGRRFAPIRSVSFTTHGATFLTLDASDGLVFPSVSYDMEPPAALRDTFHRRFGSPEELQAATMTPPLPLLINPGFGLFVLKERDPDRFRRIERVLFLPQYLGFLMTGAAACDPTYMGCHTYLWDFEKGAPSAVAEGLGVAGAFDLPLRNPWDPLGQVKPELAAELGLPADCVVTCGIHDSNASLLPYLLKEASQDFVLNSTGTWCVAMSPGGRFPLAPDELGREVFFNLSAFGRPVKTTIFRGGAEFAFWSERLGRGTEHPDELDEARLRRILETGAAVLPTPFPGSGMFPRSRASLVRAELLLEDPALAYLALDLSLAIQSRPALLATTAREDPTVFVEGGFRHNVPYTRLLAALLGTSTNVYLSGLAEATSFGAAILGVCAVEGCEPAALASRFTIDTTPVAAARVEGLAGYEAYVLSLVEAASQPAAAFAS